MLLGSQPTESDPAPRLGVSENGHMHWPHWTGSGRMVGNSSITRRRPSTDSDRTTTGKVRFARDPLRMANSRQLSWPKP